MLSGPNLFARLHKWATRQDENFLTESLALVLEHLLVLAPDVGTRLIRQFTGGFIDVPPKDAGFIEIHPQVETGYGRPDLEICTSQRVTWVEVKAEAELRVGQLEGYRVLLAKSGFEKTQLVLLTRYPEAQLTPEGHPDLEIRWFELADWFESELPTLQAVGELAIFLVRQFLDFLGVRGMTLTQVGKYMPEGVRALNSLLNMLVETAAVCKISSKPSAGSKFLGLNLDGAKFWIGIRFTDPERLVFHTRCQIDPQKANRLGIGEVKEESWVPGRYLWRYSAELDSEDVHFFERTKVSQMQWLESFLKDCLTKAHSIKTLDQPPIPEDPHED